jgi:hydrogenase maturation protease
METLEPESGRVLVLGIGNILMGDEGVGVCVVRHLEGMELPSNVDCLDGGVSGLTLLEPMQLARLVIIIDATVDGQPLGTVRRLRPRFSKDYPRTLTAHDIGLKDLLDVFYLLGDEPDVTLFAVSIEPPSGVDAELSQPLAELVPGIAERVFAELTSPSDHDP